MVVLVRFNNGSVWTGRGVNNRQEMIKVIKEFALDPVNQGFFRVRVAKIVVVR